MVRIDPLASSLVERAAAVARDSGAEEIGIEEVLRALLHRPPTPALVQSILRAAAIADDVGSDHISELHLFRAQLSDRWSQPTQLVAELSGVDAITERIDLLLAHDVAERES